MRSARSTRRKSASSCKPWKLLLSVMLGCWLLSSVNASAQTPCATNCVLVVGQSYTLTGSHDGANTTGYRVFLDGAKVGADLPLSALSSGSVTVAALVAPARGSHSVQLAAFNLDKEIKSDPLTFTVQSPSPTKPGPLQILIAVVVAEDGTTTWKVIGVEPVPSGL